MNEKSEALRLVDVPFALRDGLWHTQADHVLLNLRMDSELLRAQRDALLEALRLVQVDCQHLHHEKKDQHTLSQPCPVVDRINAAIKAVEGEKK